ncbi:unnamed protein product [Mytilus edulis]|uniref:B box-type domain-containing protein n=1 Tax=Mytilus edulis TaxID=6550 RepID=A0A8S3UA76_MYTED|nr:unnamed protein product [Mytilus edulis]
MESNVTKGNLPQANRDLCIKRQFATSQYDLVCQKAICHKPMGSSVSKGNLPQAQCPVQPVQQAQNPVHGVKQAQLPVQCGLCKIDPRVKWKCVNCDIFLCTMCKDTTHSRKEHRVIDIKAAELKISNVIKYITDFAINHIEVCFDGSLWIGDGFFRNDIGLFDSATARTGIQNVKVQGNKCKAINTFNLEINCIALTLSNDLLLATNENCLKQIAAGSKKVKDSIYCVKSLKLTTVHVSKDGECS